MAVAVRSVRWSSHAMLLLAHDGREQHEHPSMASSRVRGAPVCPPDELRVRGAPLRRAGRLRGRRGAIESGGRRGHPPPPPACRPQRPIQSMMVLAKTAASGHRAARNKQTRTQRPPPGSPCVPCRAMPCHARRPVGLSLSLSKRSKWDAHGAGGGPRGGMNDGLAWPGRSKLSLGNPTTGS
jgi:hypothetical protein